MSKLSFQRYLQATIDAAKNHFKLLTGAIAYPVQSRRWRRFVRSHAVLSKLALHYPHLLHKIYRPYLSRELGCAARVDLLIGHYRLLFDARLGDLLGRAALQPVPVAEFAGKSGAIFTLQLGAIGVAHREGELTLSLMQHGRCLYQSSFVMASDGGELVVALGSLQGLRASDGADVIKVATRELHGCRPKNLMVAVVRALGQHFGATRMLLVSNRNRIAVNRRRALRISADYDQTWDELGARRRADGNFELPCADNAPDFDAIASHKRAIARRRNALLAAICATARMMLGSAAKSLTLERA